MSNIKQAMSKVYDEKVAVPIVRDGRKMQVPFCELREGDIARTLDGTTFTVMENAYQSEDPLYGGWIVYGYEWVDYYPEDFGAQLVRTKESKHD